MKKILAVSLLVLCNLAAALAASAFNFCMFFLTGCGFAATAIIALAPFCAMGYGHCFWKRIFKEKFAVKTSVFALISYIPPVIAAGAYWLVFVYLEKSGYFKGMFGGGFELVFAISLTVTAVLYPVSTVIWRIGTKNTKYI